MIESLKKMLESVQSAHNGCLKEKKNLREEIEVSKAKLSFTDEENMRLINENEKLRKQVKANITENYLLEAQELDREKKEW